MPVTVLGLTLARKRQAVVVVEVVIEAKRVETGAFKDGKIACLRCRLWKD